MSGVFRMHEAGQEPVETVHTEDNKMTGEQILAKLEELAEKLTQGFQTVTGDEVSLNRRLRKGIEEAHRGETKDLGDFAAQYLEDGETRDFVCEAFEPVEDAIHDIQVWWESQANKDAVLVSEKFKEYGTTALSDLGYQMAELMGWDRPSRQEAQELAVYYFMLGKMARWKNALLRGEGVSNDTLTDLACYAMIARKARHSGGWPNADM